MERDERKRECDQPAQDMPRKLAAFWGNQLQRIKRRAEEQGSKTSASSNSDGKFRFELDVGTGNESTWVSNIPHPQPFESDVHSH